MKRSAPLKRRTRLRAKRPSKAVIDLRADVVASQFFGWCNAGTSACTGVAAHAHHRLPRAHGGKDTRENLLAVCAACHHYIHTHPAESYERGWLTRSGKAAA